MRKVIVDPKTPMLHNAKPHLPKFIWAVSTLVALAGLSLQAISIYAPDWLLIKAITYTYMHKGTRRAHNVSDTRIGLSDIRYDGNSVIQTWDSKLEIVKERGYLTIQTYQQSSKGSSRSFLASLCPAACREAIVARIKGYETLLGANNKLILFLVVSCVLGSFGILWYLFVGESIAVTGSLWSIASLGSIFATMQWKRVTLETWTTICSLQQIPFPKLAKNYHITLFGGLLFLGSTIFIVAAGFICSFLWRRKMENLLNQQLRNENDQNNFLDNFMPFNAPGTTNPSAPGTTNAPPQPTMQQIPGFSPNQLFTGIGFGQNNQANSQNVPPGVPQMWNRNVQY